MVIREAPQLLWLSGTLRRGSTKETNLSSLHLAQVLPGAQSTTAGSFAAGSYAGPIVQGIERKFPKL